MTTKHLCVLASGVLLSGCVATVGSPMRGVGAREHLLQESGGVEVRAQDPSADQDLDESTSGYPVEPRQVGGPTDVTADLKASFPQPDSLLGGRPPQAYFDWKKASSRTTA